MTTQQKMTKDDWYIVCEALEAWADKLVGWANLQGYSSTMSQVYKDEATQVGELLARLVNTKLREGDKWRRFGEYVD